MVRLNDAQVTAKCVELSKCLVNTSAGLINLDLQESRTIGDAARIAVSIRQSDELDKKTFAGISTALKIDYRLAESGILNIFELLDWIEVKKRGRVITKIIEQIPPTEDILSELGKLWKQDEPTPIDIASVQGLHKLSGKPFDKSALISDLDISEDQFKTFFDYGEQANYLGSFISLEQNETIWTPLYWAGKMDQVLNFLQKQTGEKFSKLYSLTNRLVNYPGTPTEKIPKDPLINSGIYHGYFPSIRIKNRQKKEHEYVFAATPQFEVDPSKDIFEKARLIVSCIRHGQYHAEISKILYPRSILRAMRNNIMKPHPYADIQYALLKLHGIVSFESDRTRYGKAIRVKWIDSSENNLAADIADELLKGEEPVVRSSEEIEAKNILVQGMFNYSSEQRRLKTTRKIQASQEFDRLMECVTGVRR